MIWRLGENGATPLAETDLPTEDFLERHLEDWIELHPDLLEEDLMIVGRQVPIAGDRIDLLAVDPAGSLVVIELKRDAVGGDVDFQALRYASYVSRWTYNDIRGQAERYADAQDKGEGFLDALDEFVEAEAELNSDQRIIIVGRRLRDKIGSVALWLLERDVDIKVVELVPHTDEDGELFVAPTVVVPPPTAEDYEIGKGSQQEPWTRDGRNWHLNERCNEATGRLLEELETVLLQLPQVVSSWGQKFYVAFNAHEIGYYRWITVRTRKTQLNVETRWPAGHWTEAAVAEQLQLPDDRVEVQNYDERFDTVTVKLSPDFSVEDDSFEDFISQAHRVFPSIWENETAQNET